MRKISGFAGLYSVTDDGRVFSHLRNHFLRPRLSNGYHRVCLYKDGQRHFIKVHRLVAGAYLHKPYNATEVNHLDKNRTNNHISNLEWCTKSENMWHSRRNSSKRLDPKTTKLVRLALQKGASTREISDILNVIENTILAIKYSI